MTALGYDLNSNHQVCTRCIYDDRVDSIVFDATGVCNYCNQLDGLVEEYGTAKAKGVTEFERILDQIKAAGKSKPYDCIIGVSGGTDSSFMIHQAVNDWGLRPLAVHYDNTWNSAIATQNIARVLHSLNVDLCTHVVNNVEADDLFLAFFRAGVAEIEASTDLALAEVMYRAAWKHGVRYVLEGHSFMAEGITPLGRNYFDGQYIRSIHHQFGTIPIKSYPLMTFKRFMFWILAARIRKIRPFWYLNYNKEDARNFLEREYNWQYYGGHHLENRMAAFFHSVYAPQKFGMDFRNNTLSALVRNAKMNRAEAWNKYQEPPYIEDGLVTYFQKRLGLSEDEYASIMAQEPKTWFMYPTYKKRFERMRPIFKVLAKANLVPYSFYVKYCFPSEPKD